MYTNSHYDNPNWDSIKNFILNRDNFKCRNCGKREGENICDAQVVKSRYNKKENNIFHVNSAYIIKKNQFLAYSEENEKEIRNYLEKNIQSCKAEMDELLIEFLIVVIYFN